MMSTVTDMIDKRIAASLRRIAQAHLSARMSPFLVGVCESEADRIAPPGKTANCPPIVLPSMVPVDPPLPDESKLPQEFALAGICRKPVDDEWFVEVDGLSVNHMTPNLCLVDEYQYRRHILAKRRDTPPGHLPWHRKDGGGYRPWKKGEWFVAHDGTAKQAGPTDYTPFSYWILEPLAPKGYRLKSEEDGGGYRAWEKGEWILTIDGQARCAKGVGGTSSAWILEPLAPCMVFVPDEGGEWRLTGLNVFQPISQNSYWTPTHSRHEVPAAVVKKWLADTGNTQIRPGKLNLITPEGDDDD